MPAGKLKQYLDSNGVRYVCVMHSTAYTAQEVAALTHTRGRELAKTVIVNLDGAMAMAVVPASLQVDLEALKRAAGAASARLASEGEFRDRFPECETGAMPPFGNLYDMAVYADEMLTQDREIAFNAGTHNELVRLSFDDFARLAQPRVARFAAAAGRMTA